jgi:hypothetical protein
LVNSRNLLSSRNFGSKPLIGIGEDKDVEERAGEDHKRI